MSSTPMINDTRNRREDLRCATTRAAERYEAVRGGDGRGDPYLRERTRHRIELIHIVTDPAHRGEGVASVLVRTTLAEARSVGRCPSW